ncbi:MAG: efflux RND transporter periplasmic adaptor subunit [Sterolibacteriaceae bacterium]|nr:efflux RND transporter periplasmic adaptor subunit [Candidatus Methylophosphatis haderslevensis]
MRKHWLLLGTVVTAAVIVGAIATRRPTSPVDASAKPDTDARVVAQAQVVPIDGIIEVRPLAEGKVLRVLAHPGDHVKTGQLLAEIESDLESAAVRQRRADREAAAARLTLANEGVRSEEQAALTAAAEAAKQEADLARDRLQRQRALRGQGFVAEQSVIEAESSLRIAEARAREAAMRARAGVAGGRAGERRAAREAVSSAGAALAQGEVALSRTRIVAPIAGVVMARNVNPGDIIGSNVTSPTLFRIVDPARVEIRFEVEELLASRVEVGLPVEFVLPGSKTVVGHGKVTRIAPQVEKRSIGADDARIRADSMVRPAWSDFTAQADARPLPVNYRLEAWIRVSSQGAGAGAPVAAEF